MKIAFMLSFLAAIFSGCSKQGAGLVLTGVKGSGDVVPFFFQCATNRGAYVPTNTLPNIQAEWTHQTRDMQDIILVVGDHFAAIQDILEQAYGVPNPELGSSVVAPNGIGKTFTYSPRQSGVVLNITGYPSQTVINVMGWKKQ